MTVPGRSHTHPETLLGIQLWLRSVRATRNPLLLFRFPVSFLLRFAAHKFLGLLFQEPPRNTRSQGDGQALGTDQIYRPERSLGASAMCSHGQRALSMH